MSFRPRWHTNRGSVVKALIRHLLLLFFSLPVPGRLPHAFPFNNFFVLFGVEKEGLLLFRFFQHLCPVLLHRNLDESIGLYLVWPAEESLVLVLAVQVRFSKPLPEEEKGHACDCEAYQLGQLGFDRTFPIELLFHVLEGVQEAVHEEKNHDDTNASNCKHPKALFVPVIYEYIDASGRPVEVLGADASRACLLLHILATVAITFVQVLQAAPTCKAVIQHLILRENDRL